MNSKVMKEKFKNAVDAGDIILARIFIANELMLDPRGSTFKEMLEYAEPRFPELYQTDDGKNYPQDELSWDENFLFQLKNDLDFNFSQAKVRFYEKVAKVVLKEKARNLDREEAERKRSQQRSNGGYHSGSDGRSRKGDNMDSTKTVHTTIAAGGAAAVVAGLILERVLLSTLGAAGLIIGGILLYKDLQDNDSEE